MEELIAKRYVKALLSIAKQDKKATYIEAMNAISVSFDNPKVFAVIKSPIISTKSKVTLLVEALGKDTDAVFVHFIRVLAESKRLNLIPAVTKILNEQMQKENNLYEGVVKSQNKLDAGELEELEKTLKRYTGSTVKLVQEKSDLDGLRVNVDDLGIEVNFSKARVKEQLIDFIKKSL